MGILGGTFNPPHLGHLALARQARDELGLDRVVLMPLHTPPHKPADGDPGPLERLAMCRLAVAGEPGISVCRLELDRGGPSYTADTLSEINARNPEAELTFIVGADTALTLASWHEPRTVLRLARLAVAGRPGSSEAEVRNTVEGLASSGERAGISFLAMKPTAVSSSLARSRIAAGMPVDDLLAGDVAEYVAAHGLYGAMPREAS